jgi:alpha-beta hydrolase superfamily lysophospholipase
VSGTRRLPVVVTETEPHQTAGYPDLVAGPAFTNPHPDVLGEGYEALTAELPDDAEGELVATLVRYRTDRPTTRAVLYLHGFSDYFHQVELAEFHAARGETFYALDLHKYGRSLGAHQTPARMSDVADYYPELDAAVEFITGEGHRTLVLNAHSTGGLIGLLWLHDRRTQAGTTIPIEAVVLNSPFLDVPATWPIRALAPRPFAALARNRPLMVLPSPERSLYQMSIHRSERGEWDFITDWKPIAGGTVRIEWLAAAQRAIARAHAGLDLNCPILMMCAARSIRAKQWTDELYRGDAVLDVDALARWSTRLGSHVTVLRVADGMHDLLLSRPDVRKRVYADINRWMNAYAPGADRGVAP